MSFSQENELLCFRVSCAQQGCQVGLSKSSQKFHVSNFFCGSNNFVPLREEMFLDDSLEVNKQLIKVLIIYYNE